MYKYINYCGLNFPIKRYKPDTVQGRYIAEVMWEFPEWDEAPLPSDTPYVIAFMPMYPNSDSSPVMVVLNEGGIIDEEISIHK